jgi:hypothetical protein
LFTVFHCLILLFYLHFSSTLGIINDPEAEADPVVLVLKNFENEIEMGNTGKETGNVKEIEIGTGSVTSN